MRRAIVSLSIMVLLVSAVPAFAHFGMIIPSKPVVEEQKDAGIELTLRFWHPFENVGMELETPAAVTMLHDGATVDLTKSLVAAKERGHTLQTLSQKLDKPGLYTFVMRPAPYFEPAEDCFIVHYTKVMVPAFGLDVGWDEPVGLPVEIIPLAKPFGLYAGNVFQGRVLENGKPVPGAEVEVEFYPGPGLKGEAPNDFLTTQTVKADDAGIFTYAVPKAGWWGFAALREGPEKLKHAGKDKAVEIGGVIWVHAEDFPAMKPAE